jgi:hypothetical protein
MAIERDQLACNYYRILMPLNKVDEQELAEVYFVKESQVGESSAFNLAVASDIIVFARPSTKAWFDFIKACRKLGKIVVTDYDDDPFNTSPMNPYYQYVGVEPVLYRWADGTEEWLWSEEMISPTGKKIFDIERNIQYRDMFRLNFRKSDLVTCTTEILRQEFLTINQNVEVLPNVIDLSFYPQGQDFVKREVRVGWQGGASHYEDLYMVRNSIINVLKKHKNVKFVYFGDLRFKGLFKDAPQDQIEWHSWVQHHAYPYKLATLNLDIGLCPIVSNQFNRNKSAIKWMEYSALGIASIVSNMPPYSPVVVDSETALVADETDASWTDCLERLVMDKFKRLRISKSAKDDVIKNHNIETKAHLWAEAYERTMKKEAVLV